MNRPLREAVKRGLVRLHHLALRAHVVVLPDHYYSPVPNVLQLRATRDRWARASELPGVAVDLDGQAERLRRTCLPFREEYAGNPAYRWASGQRAGPGYGYIEAQALHGFIRSVQPARVVEVGCGVSTWCMAAAGARNRQEGGREPALTCIDPSPSAFIRSLAGLTVVARPVQEVPMETFQGLRRGDLLFIDSSHAVKVGSDVNFLVLEVLPRLRPGVFVHLHDIYLPYDYSRHVLHGLFASEETALVHAFLIGNTGVRMVFCLSLLHYLRPAVLKEVFPEYDPEPDVDGLAVEPVTAGRARHFPSALYLEVVG